MPSSDRGRASNQVVNAKTERDAWNDRFRRVVEYFEATENHEEWPTHV